MQTNQPNQNQQDKKVRHLIISVIMIVIISMGFGALFGSYLTINSINKSFALGEVHLCNAEEINYAEELMKVKQYKQNLMQQCGIPNIVMNFSNITI